MRGFHLKSTFEPIYKRRAGTPQDTYGLPGQRQYRIMLYAIRIKDNVLQTQNSEDYFPTTYEKFDHEKNPNMKM